MTNTEEVRTPAYCSWRTVYNFFEILRDNGVPNKIDSSTLRNYSGAVQSQLRSALKFLDLVDEDDRSQSELYNLVQVSTDEKRSIMAGVLRRSYDFLYEKIDVKTASYNQFRQIFNEQGLTGETARKAEVFFIKAAEFAGIEISPWIQSGKPNVSRHRDNKRVNHRKSKSTSSATETQQPGTNHANEEKKTSSNGSSYSSEYPLLSTLLTQLPSNHQWTQIEREKWIQAHTAVLDLLIKVVDE